MAECSTSCTCDAVCSCDKNVELIHICQFCKRQFSHKYVLRAHVVSAHHQPMPPSKANLLCPGENCTFSSLRYVDLRKHINASHIKLEEPQTLTFSNIDEFEQWKEREEKEKFTFFKKTTSDKRCTVTLRKYYNCHRSGAVVSKVKDRKRQRLMKAQGSCKMGTTCPSTLTAAVQHDGQVTVEYYRSHYGHDQHSSIDSKKKINFTTACQDPLVAEMIERKIPLATMLTNIKNSVSRTEEITRLHLLIKKFLNMTQKVAVNLPYWDQDDAVSVDNWVASISMSNDNPVILYKAEGVEFDIFQPNDIFLALMDKCQIILLRELGPNGKICIDFLHSAGEYDISLMGIFVSDKFGSAFPVAYCLSNRHDVEVIKLFFTMIKENVGKLHVHLLMCNDEPIFYEAWKSVMGENPDQILLNSWDTDKNWRTNFFKFHRKTGTVKKAEIYRALRVLIEEQNLNVFEELQEHFINVLLNDEETKDYATYFQETYAPRAEKWAYCYGIQHIDLNSKMHFEALHRALKHIYYDSKRLKRMDKCLVTLLQFTRDQEFDHLVKVSKGTMASMLRDIHLSHKEGLDIPESVIKESQFGQKWLIKCVSDSDKFCEVQKVQESCNIENCNLFCEMCQMCMHSFICTCEGYRFQSNMCKHVHRVINLFQQSIPSSVQDANFKICFNTMFSQGVSLYYADSKQSDLDKQDEHVTTSDVLEEVNNKGNENPKVSSDTSKASSNCTKDNLIATTEMFLSLVKNIQLPAETISKFSASVSSMLSEITKTTTVLLPVKDDKKGIVVYRLV